MEERCSRRGYGEVEEPPEGRKGAAGVDIFVRLGHFGL